MYGTRRFYRDRGGLGGGGELVRYEYGYPLAARLGRWGWGWGRTHAKPRASFPGGLDRPFFRPAGGGQPRVGGLRTLAGPRASFACGPGCSATAQPSSASALHMVSRCWESRADHANAAPHPSPTLRLSPLGRRKGEADSKLPGDPPTEGGVYDPLGWGGSSKPTTDNRP